MPLYIKVSLHQMARAFGMSQIAGVARERDGLLEQVHTEISTSSRIFKGWIGHKNVRSHAQGCSRSLAWSGNETACWSR